MKRIGLLTSGGDSPGMNSAIRAVVRKAMYERAEIIGVRRGFKGLVEGDFLPMDSRSVSGIINRGGTLLLSSRCEEFKTRRGQRKAVENIKKWEIDGLVVIGGDGSYHGAYALYKTWGIPTVGIPGTIDNDLWGTDITIGFDTAVNIAVEAIDRIRDTATSHERLFIIEVMGKTSGFIALYSGVAGGVEDLLIPEMPTELENIIERLEIGRKMGKVSSILVVAEGDEEGGAMEIARKIEDKVDYETRVLILGHLQRGGPPTALDRILATRLGAMAVEILLEGGGGVAVGWVNGAYKIIPLPEAWRKKKKIDPDLYLLNLSMAT